VRDDERGIYVELADLMRLEHLASGFSFLPRQPVHSLLAGRHASRLRGRGLDFDEIRRYHHGDDVRTIDWRVTQRTGKPHVRVFTEERDRPALLLVDQRRAMFFGTRRNVKSVTCAELTALAAWRVVSSGDRVGGLVFDDEEVTEIRPLRSRQRVRELLAAVVAKNRALHAHDPRPSRPEMLVEVLRRTERQAVHDHLVCVISDFHGLDDEARGLLTRLAQHNDLLCALIYDPVKTGLPEAGRLVVSDGELQLELDTGSGKIRRHLGEYFSADLDRTRNELARVGVPVLLIETETDPADQIRRQLGLVPVAGR
jgi:uncharacterized protein (DUF58 family)